MPLSRLYAEGALARGAGYDVRGYEVRTLVDGTPVGSVEDLLADDGGTPRYIVVETAAGERAYPIGLAHADRDARLVWVPGLSRRQLEALPPLEASGDAGDDAAGGASLSAAERALSVALDETLRGGTQGAGQPFGFPEVVPLSRLPDLAVAEDQADPRGWGVGGSAGELLGTVSELLVNEAALKVVFLVVDRAGADTTTSVLVPIADARLDEANRMVVLDGADAETLSSLPPYDAGAAGTAIRQALQGLASRRAAGPYASRRYDPRIFFGPMD